MVPGQTSDGTSQPPPGNGWVLFDGSCGFCSWWIPMWTPTLQRLNYSVAPLQAEWVRKTLQLSDSELLSEIRLLKPNGERVAGADVYRDVMRRVWWIWPLYCLSVLPVFRWLFDSSYRLFNKNRYRISKSCGLKPPAT